MIKKHLPDGNIYYVPSGLYGFNSENIDKEIDEIYNENNSHHYERYYKIKKGMTVIDAGAYTGIFTLKASKLVGPEGIVIALEPFSISFKVLEYNVKKNRCNNVLIFNEGIGRNICKKKMIIKNNYIGSYILNKYDSNLKQSMIWLLKLYRMIFHRTKLIEVSLTTLDEIMHRCDVEKIDFLKIDIEGYETEALLGYNQIKRNNIMVIESHRNLDEILFRLKEKGYALNKTLITPINGKSSLIHTKF